MDSLKTPPASAALIPGAVIAERYRLIRKLGEGGMGAVFLAEHMHMRKRFALKLLLPEAMASAELVARFEREAVAAGSIDHPGVCAATDFGRLPDGSFFLVLEYIEGKSLRALIADEPIRPSRALAITRQVLAALAAAHAKGVIHRDIKPENVMLGVDDLVKVLDFGIAKIDANSLGPSSGTNLTRMGAIYGTPTYMAPEQAMGAGIDHRVDIYAVGVILHEMITGRPPFNGDGIVVLAQHVNEPPPPVTSQFSDEPITSDVAALVARLLAKAPTDRFADAAAAVAEIDRIQPGPVTAAFPSSPRPPSVRVVTAQQAAVGVAEVGAPTVVGQSATLAGTARESPVRVFLERVRAGATRLAGRVATRLGVPARHVLIAAAGLAALLVVLILVLAFRSPPEVADEARERRRPATKATSAPTIAPQPTSAAKKPSGDGVYGLGRKIQSSF